MIPRLFRGLGVVLLALTTVAALATVSLAGDGDLDVSFSGDGWDEPFSTYNSGNGVAIDGDGLVVVAGGAGPLAGVPSLLLARYLPDGTHDVSFGDDGLVQIPHSIVASDVVIDDENRITVSGRKELSGGGYVSVLGVARLLADGSPDPSFSDDGVATTSIGDSSQGNAVAVDAHGRTVVVGASRISEGWDAVIVRYLPDGSLDASFGSDGVLVFDPGVYRDIAIDSKGRIVVAGETRADYSVQVMRLLPDGSLDPSFGGIGVVTTPVANVAGARAVVVDDEDRIVVAGVAGVDTNRTDHQALVIRYLDDGTLDTSFSDDGIVTTDVTEWPDDSLSAVSIDLVGNIVVGGNSSDNHGGGAGSGLLIRYLPDGSIDPSFSDDGIVPDTPSDFRIRDLAVDEMGDIVAVGSNGFFNSPAGFVSGPSPVDPQLNQGMVVARFEGAGFFRDDAGSVFEDDINAIAALGITRGCNPPDNTNYCPDGHVTRGQMAAFLTRALDLPPTDIDAFIDDDESVFEDDINRMAAAGITKGCNPPANDAFCPERKVTREQMAAFLVRAFSYTDDGGGDLFSDDDGSIFEGDIDKLATAGVTKGCNPPTNDQFCPTRNVTRGQMAAFLHRALS